jgi:transposase
MRYELSDLEWAAIKPILPNKPRGLPRVNDRRVLNGIFWILRSAAPWRDLPESFGPLHYLLRSLCSLAEASLTGRSRRDGFAKNPCSCASIDTVFVGALDQC